MIVPRDSWLRGLRVRLVAGVVLVAFVAATTAIALSYRGCRARALADLHGEIDSLMDAAATTAAIGAYAADRALLQQVVDGLAQDASIASVEVVSAAGDVLASHGATANAIGDVAPEAVTQSQSQSRSMVLEHALKSPFDSEEVVASLRVRADTSIADSAARGEAGRLAEMLLGLVGLIALVLWFAVEHLIALPIVRLARTLRAMSPGSGERLKTPLRHLNDEIGLLIHGGNEVLRASEHALRRERKLRVEKERLEIKHRQMFESIGAGSFVLDLSGRLLSNNAVLLEIVGLPRSVLAELRAGDFIRQAFVDPERVRGIVADASQRREAVWADLELRPRGRPERWVCCLLSVRHRPGEPLLVDGLMIDITERRAALVVAVRSPRAQA